MASNSITVNSNKNPSIVNEEVYFFGNYRDDLGEPIREAPLWWRNGGQTPQKVYTDIDNGRFGFQIKFTATGQYNIQVCESENFGIGSAQANMIQLVTQAPPTKVTLKVAVNDLTQGDTNPSPGEYVKNLNEQVTVTAIPKAGSGFDHWLINNMTQTSTNPLSLVMDANKDVTAYFSYTPPPPPPPNGDGSNKCNFRIVATLGGTTNPPPGDYVAYKGQQIGVAAVPSSGYRLKQWVRNGSNMGDAASITVNIDVNSILLVATFIEIPPTDPWSQFLKWWNTLPMWQKILLGGGVGASSIAVIFLSRRK